MEDFGDFRKARAERSVVCLLGILILLLPTTHVCLTRVGGEKRSGSVCAIGVVSLGIVCVEVVLFGLDSGRNGGDEDVGDSFSF